MYQILVIDDEFPIREWLVHVIRKNRPDYSVLSAQNGIDALNQLDTNECHLIISDIRMPQLDGIGLFEKLKHQYPSIGIIVLSSYDDYAYVRAAFKHSAIDYLLKAEITEESLLLSIDHFFEKDISINYEEKISGILKCAIDSPSSTSENLREQLSEYHIVVPNKNIFLFLSHCLKPFIPSISQISLVFFVPIDIDVYLGCISLNIIPSTLVQLQTQSLFSQKFREFNTCKCILLSEILYDAAALVPMLKLISSYRTISFYHKTMLLVGMQSQICYPQYFQYYLDIINSIKTRSFEKIQAAMTVFFEYITDCLFPDISQLYITGIKLLEELYLNLAELKAETLAAQSQILTEKIHNCNNIADFKQTLLDETSTIFSKFHIVPNSNSFRIEKAIRHIEQNYSGSMTLNEVANIVYLNPEYFSRIFKKETGTNFNNYVNGVRLQKALQLVNQTDLKLFEIAEMCGFQSFSYFSKRFKEMFGCSPHALRSLRIEDTHDSIDDYSEPMPITTD